MKKKNIFRIAISVIIMTMMLPTMAYAGRWKRDITGYRYLNDDGSYKTGWYQDIDEKWYYLDDQSGYMLSDMVTPDGYTVSSDGVWIEGGENTTILNGNEYDNEIELDVSAYESGPNLVESFGYSFPVTVHYNNEYVYGGGEKVQILSMSVSKDGVLYTEYSMNEKMYYYEISALSRYIMDDGTYIDAKERPGCISFGDNDDIVSVPIMDGPGSAKGRIVSAEVYIDMGNTD